MEQRRILAMAIALLVGLVSAVALAYGLEWAWLERVVVLMLAVVLGVGGTIGFFFGAHAVVMQLPRVWQERCLPWVYVSPAIALLAAYLVLPTLNTIYLSFLDRRSDAFVGWANYGFVLTDKTMGIAIRNNVLWLVLVTGFSVSLGLLLAVLADRVRYEAIAKSAIFLPMAISFVGASTIWKFVYAYRPAGREQIGLLNAIATGLGGEPVGWLVERPLNTLALIAIMIWLQTGFCMVLLSAAIKAIPADILEAARIDGANEWQIFMRIALPTIRPTIAVVATTVIILVLKVFDIVYVTTAGNQGTEVLASRMIKEMFNFGNFGRGSAIAVVLMVAIVPVVIGNIRRVRQQEIES